VSAGDALARERHVALFVPSYRHARGPDQDAAPRVEQESGRLGGGAMFSVEWLVLLCHGVNLSPRRTPVYCALV
jgi:hypothetical protein